MVHPSPRLLASAVALVVAGTAAAVALRLYYGGGDEPEGPCAAAQFPTPERKRERTTADVGCMEDPDRCAKDCQAGDAVSCLGLSHHLDDPEDKLLSRACTLGHGEACVDEAIRGRDPAKKLKLLTRACRQGYGLGCEMAAEYHRKGQGTGRSYACFEAFMEKGCALGNAEACEALSTCKKAPRTDAASPAFRVVKRFLAAGSKWRARSYLDLPWHVRRWSVLELADPWISANSERVFEIRSSGTDAGVLNEWRKRRDCVVRAGTPEERLALAPVLYPVALTPQMRAYVLKTRERFDRAEVVVGKCRCDEEQRFLVDPTEGKILAMEERSSRPPSPRSALSAAELDSWKPVSLSIEAHPKGAELEWEGRKETLPVKIEGLIPETVVRATVRAPGYEPYALERVVGPTEHDRALGGAQQRSFSWFVVLYPERPKGQ